MKPRRHQIRFAVLRLRGPARPRGQAAVAMTIEEARAIINMVSDKDILDAGFYGVKEIRRLAE